MTTAPPISPPRPADHGGGIDAAARLYGGTRADWLDLSTAINPVPYPVPLLPPDAWTALPDQSATDTLEAAARAFWSVPTTASILAAPGASALIARLPHLIPAGTVHIPGPTYNEHARSFTAAGWIVTDGPVECCVAVHPNNPDGRLWSVSDLTARFTVIDESFCDVAPDASLIALATRPQTIILKSFGKFWGLAGLRLGFAIGDPALIAALAQALGPWPVSGAALAIGAAALTDPSWADATRARLATDAARLDALIPAPCIGGTTLFRLYRLPDAAATQARLARHRIWSRVFPYDPTWLRLGLPGTEADWDRLTQALR